MKMNEFLAQHAVFTVGELNKFLSARGSNKLNTRKALLAYYRSHGRVIPVRRGLYAAVPLGSAPSLNSIDPYLVAAKLATDAVLAYHTALEFHGKAYTTYTRLTYTSTIKSAPLKLDTYEFKGVPVPRPLRTKRQEMFGVSSHKRSGVELRVTSLERTLVDALDRPDLTGSWEEIWRSLESIEFFDLEQVIKYALLLKNSTIAAKVGFYLEQHKQALMVEDTHLKPLRKFRPLQPHYLVRSQRKDGHWVRDWNLMIPPEILNKSWGEVL